jgi:hypothetical protein
MNQRRDIPTYQKLSPVLKAIERLLRGEAVGANAFPHGETRFIARYLHAVRSAIPGADLELDEHAAAFARDAALSNGGLEAKVVVRQWQTREKRRSAQRTMTAVILPWQRRVISTITWLNEAASAAEGGKRQRLAKDNTELRATVETASAVLTCTLEFIRERRMNA